MEHVTYAANQRFAACQLPVVVCGGRRRPPLSRDGDGRAARVARASLGLAVKELSLVVEGALGPARQE
eukprot:4406197-Lingulodinium_polyedra.AAC.1